MRNNNERSRFFLCIRKLRMHTEQNRKTASPQRICNRILSLFCNRTTTLMIVLVLIKVCLWWFFTSCTTGVVVGEVCIGCACNYDSDCNGYNAGTQRVCSSVSNVLLHSSGCPNSNQPTNPPKHKNPRYAFTASAIWTSTVRRGTAANETSWGRRSGHASLRTRTRGTAAGTTTTATPSMSPRFASLAPLARRAAHTRCVAPRTWSTSALNGAIAAAQVCLLTHTGIYLHFNLLFLCFFLPLQ
jgi:hypothetical protein